MTQVIAEHIHNWCPANDPRIERCSGCEMVRLSKGNAMSNKPHKLYLPWKVCQNWHGKIAIVDSRNDDDTTTKGRVCNLAQGKNGRGLFVAQAICDAMNRNAK